MTEDPAECGFCGAPGATADHVPSRKFFPQPRPSDLVTVPACNTCNNKTSADEEHFLHVMMSHVASEGPIVEALRSQRFSLPKTERRLRVAREMLSKVRMIPVHTPGGIYLGHAPALEGIDFGRLERVFEKIVRGLYFAEYGERPPADRHTQSMLDPHRELMGHPVAQLVLREGRGRRVSSGEFDYRIARAEDGSATALCVMLFWNVLPVLSWLLRTEPGASEVI
jgi:hypothetical protein